MRAQYKIRRAAPGDLERIGEIEDASFGREAYDRKLFAYYLRRCGDLFLVAVRRSARDTEAKPRWKICGYLLACVRGGRLPGSAELVSVAVEPPARGRGAASALLESGLRRLARRGTKRLNLVVRVGNATARAFYEKYGFRQLRTIPAYYEDGEDGLAMWRPVRLRKTSS